MIEINSYVSFIPNLSMLSTQDILYTRTFCYERAETVTNRSAKAFWIMNAINCTEALKTKGGAL